MAPTGRYREGDVFAVPLRDGGYGLGVAARATGQGPVLGYFFGPLREVVPDLVHIEELHAMDSVLVQRFGDLALLRGEWPVIGRLDDWRPQDWPIPAFGRHEALTGRCLRVEYFDDDPDRRSREIEISREELERLPADGLAGFGFIEKRLTRLLAGA